MIKLRHIFVLGATLLFSGCKIAMLDPKGIIAAKEKALLIDSTLLMLLIVVPVIILTLLVVWRFRASNKKATYKPEWSHSNLIESICWIVPCIIIGILAAATWIYSHRLDPYKPLDMKGEPLKIQVVSLNWRWLFIYPKQHIATINFVQIPVNRPVRFYITSDAPMNSFSIPQLSGQIYAMNGMRTKLNMMASEPGDYAGMSANFSGDGFSNMKFTVRAGSNKDFEAFVAKAKQSPDHLTLANYLKVAKPTEDHSVHLYSSVADKLFNKVIMKYMKPGMENLGLPSKSTAVTHQS